MKLKQIRRISNPLTSICFSIIKTFFTFCLFVLFFADTFHSSFAGGDVPYTSAIVVDATSGEILYSYNPDKIVYPASLTKIMTSYVVFDALKKSSLGLSDVVKFGRNENNSATVNDLLLKMIVNSSNYPTEILAKEICGDVKNFVLRMNAVAKEIGMKNTNFVNPHGLFNEKHVSTARDIAMLAIRLVYDFPTFSEYFGITNYLDDNGEFKVKTSDIQLNIRGIEGSKTGYINASGYNLAVWGRYGKRHIFAVVIGADNKVSRDGLIIRLINQSIGDDIEKTLPNKKKFDGNMSLLNEAFRFLNINLSEYLLPVPVERGEVSGKRSSNHVDGTAGYFYKKK